MPKNTIRYFMWGYQKHFCSMQSSAATRIFQLLDDRFSSEVFLVGIRRPERVDGYPACVEPEDDFWLESDFFNNVLGLAATLQASYPESGDLHSLPLAHQRWQEGLFLRSVRDAILETLKTHEAIDPGKEYCASVPAIVDNYLVSVILGLQSKWIAAHYRLSRDTIGLPDDRPSSVTRSLIDATVSEFFAVARAELQKPDPGLHYEAQRDADEMVRAAARHLMTDCAVRADDNAFDGWHNLFHACATISAMYYEKAPGKGRMVLARRDHEALKVRASFTGDLTIDRYRAARKLLELSSENAALHSNSHQLFGLVDVGDYVEGKENLFEIHFLGHHEWELSSHRFYLRADHCERINKAVELFDERAKKEDPLMPRIVRAVFEPNVDLNEKRYYLVSERKADSGTGEAENKQKS